MKRRLTLVAVSLATLAVPVGMATAHADPQGHKEKVCLLLAHDPNGRSTDDLCITVEVPVAPVR